VIGVGPRGFRGLSGEAQLWIPATMAPHVSYADYLTTDQSFISVVGHLRAHTSFEVARAELALLGQAITRQIPRRTRDPAVQFSATLIPLADARIDPTTRRPLLLLAVAAGCLLILACVNVAGLLLGRAVSRRREIAIRIATGASPSRIIAQLLAEAFLLAIAGGIVGILIAIPLASHLELPPAPSNWTNFYRALAEFTAPRVDVRVAFFSVMLCTVTSFAFGIVPALRASRVDPAEDLKDGARSGASHGGTGTRGTIVAVESMLAVALLFCAGLLTASGYRLTRTKLGFEPSHLLTFLIRPSDVTYPPPKAAHLIARVLDEIERVPGVDAASVDGCVPVGAGCANSTLYIAGRPEPARDAAPPVLRHYIGPDHFKTLGVPLIRGRVFDANDRAGRNRVAIINETAARRFWPDEDPIGKRVWFGGGSNFDRPDSSAEIVGIVGDVAYQHLDRHPFQPDFYTPFAQFTYASRTVLVRSRITPAALLPEIRRAVRSANPDLALFEVRTIDDVLADSWAPLTYQTRLCVVFAIAALALAAMGIFAAITNIIGDRGRDIGIRVALGASPSRVLFSIGDHGARPACVGALLGLVVSLGVGRVLAASLFGVRPFEPVVTLVVMSATLFIIVVATLSAARRALAIDAAEALRA
jgi:putative ABC transport system permease protein